MQRRRDTRLFLWSILGCQLLIAVLYYIYGNTFIKHSDTSDVEYSGLFLGRVINETDSNNVHFLRFSDIGSKFVTRNWVFRNLTNSKRHLLVAHYREFKPIISTVNQNSFYRLNSSNLIECFKNGTNVALSESKQSCVCSSEWHGFDCGQPEIMWRAFMTARVPIKDTVIRRSFIPKIIYFIETTGASFDIAEIQALELMDLVDVFIFCISYFDVTEPQKIWRTVESGNIQHLKYKSIFFYSQQNVSLKVGFNELNQIVNISKTDLLIFSSSDEILNHNAIRYLKMYTNWPEPGRFRLRFNVYGFYWQHPENTRIGSFVISMGTLMSTFKTDPRRLTKMKKQGFVIGDLNHVGGWYCQYCYLPNDILRKLAEDKINIFTDMRSHTASINSKYITNLIGHGLYVDGKMGLTKLRQYMEKYYGPSIVNDKLTQYHHLLFNQYESYEDDYYYG